MRFLTVSLLVAALSIASCKKNSDAEDVSNDTLTNLGDSVQGAVGSLATSSEAGTIGSLAQCSSTMASGCSASGVTTIDYNGCTFSGANGATYALTGGWTDAYDTVGTCQSAPRPRTSGNVTRTSTAAVVNFPSGFTLTTDTAAHTTYSGVTVPASGVTTTFGSTTRTLQINGLRRVLRGPRGLKWFDHTLTTPSALTITGTRAMQTRSIASGTVTLYHNIAQYTATNTINNLTWANANCCYPTGGTISSVLSGGISGTFTMSFTPTCGLANYTDTAGRSSQVTLTQCE